MRLPISHQPPAVAAIIQLLGVHGLAPLAPPLGLKFKILQAQGPLELCWIEAVIGLLQETLGTQEGEISRFGGLVQVFKAHNIDLWAVEAGQIVLSQGFEIGKVKQLIKRQVVPAVFGQALQKRLFVAIWIIRLVALVVQEIALVEIGEIKADQHISGIAHQGDQACVFEL